ncbi:AraC family transcriptional regulator [Paenibacillus sp. HW567]|uniref:AraC family transcriptional regulator n=1 Tax=Paenibacillus sp. HW567 TaxID=1034769 RepID=UPI0009FDDAD1|nr:AraC family transcriptional regulator [Paenibacillus sp. HW567]
MELSRLRRMNGSDPGRWTLHLQYAELASVSSSYTMTQIMATHTTLLVLLEGSCQLKKRSLIIPMEKDTLYVCYAGTTFELAGEGEPPLVAMLRIEFYEPEGLHPGSLKSMAHYGPHLLPEELVHPVPGAAGDSCRSICGALRSDNPMLRLRAQLLTMELLLEAVPASAADLSRHSGGLERVKRYMDEHPEEPLTVERLAQLAAISPKHFAEQFKKAYGKSVREYITGLRLNRAKRLMLSSGRRLKDIAHAVGYQDEFYFSRLFKKEFGLSPSSYVNKRKQKLAAYACASILGYLLPLEQLPYLAPLHPKWASYYFEHFGTDIPYHLECGTTDDLQHPSLQRIAEAAPDMIICPDETSEAELERLQAVAPVVKLLPEAPGSWRTNLLELARLLGMNAEAGRWISQFEDGNRQARAMLDSGSGAPSVLFVRMIRGQLLGFGSSGTLDYVYNELGLRRPHLAPEDGDESAPVTLEQLEAEDVDYVALLIRQDSQTLELWHALQRTSEWSRLRVVREQRLRLLSSNPWREYSPVALERIREDVLLHIGGKKSMPNPPFVYGVNGQNLS